MSQEISALQESSSGDWRRNRRQRERGQRGKRKLGFVRHHVALPANRADQLPRRRILELAAQVVDIDIHDVGGLRRLQIPD